MKLMYKIVSKLRHIDSGCHSNKKGILVNMVNKFNIHINLTYSVKEIYNEQIKDFLIYTMNGIEIAIYNCL